MSNEIFDPDSLFPMSKLMDPSPTKEIDGMDALDVFFRFRSSQFTCSSTALLKGKFSDKRLNSWGKGSNAKKDIKDKEEWLELKVSSEIRKLWCCVFEIDDMPSKNSKRSTIEKLLINLLSNSNIDLISKNWLGKNSDSKEIMNTGLWNIQYSSGEISQEKINFLLDYLWKNYK